MTTQASEPVLIRCPKCGRFLAEVTEYGRAVCGRCGWEVTLRSRRRTAGPTDEGPSTGSGQA